MADNVTNELLLEHLKQIQSKLSKVDDRLSNVEVDMRSLKSHMTGFMQSEFAQDNSLATLQVRLDRIERRLELNE